MARKLVSVVVERMYDWSVCSPGPAQRVWSFQLLLKGCTIEARRSLLETFNFISFSCCWKDVRLKPWCSLATSWIPVSVVVERMYDCSWIYANNATAPSSFSCCWKDVRLKPKKCRQDSRIRVSVVVERMYDWSSARNMERRAQSRSFSCCWKDVRLKLNRLKNLFFFAFVSVVVERMYDWSLIDDIEKAMGVKVSVVVERMYDWSRLKVDLNRNLKLFQLLLKGCTIEALSRSAFLLRRKFQLLLKGCTIEAITRRAMYFAGAAFQLLLKGCTIEA